MELLFSRGNVDTEAAHAQAEQHDRFFEAHVGVINGQSAATYVMPRESNGFEGYLRFIIPPREDSASGSSSELHLYFSPRSLTPYRISFVYLDAHGSAGFDATRELWAHRIAVSLSSTGVLQKEIEHAPWADPLDR
jgi:hypothetical protein